MCLWRLFSTPAVCTVTSGLCLVGLEAACLHVHTLTEFSSYNLMPMKQRADQPHSERPMKHLVSCGQLWRCLPHFPVQLPQLSNTHKHTPSWQVVASDTLTAIWWVFNYDFAAKQEKSRKGSVRVSLACGSCAGLLPSLNNQVFILLSVVFFPLQVRKQLPPRPFLMHKSWLSRGETTCSYYRRSKHLLGLVFAAKGSVNGGKWRA